MGQDLEEIGLTRLQARRLQAAAKAPEASCVDRAEEAPAASESPLKQVSFKERSASPPGARARSVSQGRRFEEQCRQRILQWLEGWAVELAPKALGVHHECDLVMRLSFDVPKSQLMPSIFKSCRELTGRCEKD